MGRGLLARGGTLGPRMGIGGGRAEQRGERYGEGESEGRGGEEAGGAGAGGVHAHPSSRLRLPPSRAPRHWTFGGTILDPRPENPYPEMTIRSVSLARGVCGRPRLLRQRGDLEHALGRLLEHL